MSIQPNRFPSLPKADEIFQRPQPAVDLDDAITFDAVAGLDNPLSVPLVAAVQLVRRLRDSRDRYRATLKAAIELLHSQDWDLRQVRRRNLQLVDELRQVRGQRAA